MLLQESLATQGLRPLSGKRISPRGDAEFWATLKARPEIDKNDSPPAGRIVIAGGTGFLGGNLARRLDGLGCEVITISRRPKTANGSWEHAQWDGRNLGDWVDLLSGASAIVNLAGRTVDCVKSPDHCDEILRSRVESTRVLGQAVRQIKAPPRVWVQMSTAHIYGDPPEVVCDEDTPTGYGLAPFVGKAWERAFHDGLLPDMRHVILRTSFVLGRGGGALRRLGKAVRWGFGGTVGHGRQGISWIHEHDMNRLFTRAIADEKMSGTYVATSPAPVTNAVFMRELRRALGRPFGLPAASWMVEIAARLAMKTDPELGLYGRFCVSRRLREEGFEFAFPEVGAALTEVFGSEASG